MKIDLKVARLRASAYLASCSHEEIAAIASSSDVLWFEAGDVLRSPGSGDRTFFLILSGTAAVDTDELLGAGDPFAGATLLSEERDDRGVQMLLSGEVLVVGQREFAALLSSAPGFVRAVAEDLSKRLRQAHARNHGEVADRVA